MKIIYSDNVEGIADCKVEGLLRTTYEDNINSTIRTSNEILITCARMLIAEGVFDKDEVEFFIGEESFGFCSKHGELPELCNALDYNFNFLHRIFKVKCEGATKKC